MAKNNSILLSSRGNFVETALDNEAYQEIEKNPLLGNTLHKRINDISGNIEGNMSRNLYKSHFVFITGKAYFLALVAFIKI